jgi:hypothetical protein
MDYYQDEVLASVLRHLVLLALLALLALRVLRVLLVLLVHSLLKFLVLAQLLRSPLSQLSQLHQLLREMPSTHQDLHQALLLVLPRVLDLPLRSSWQRSFSQLPSLLASSLQQVLHLGTAQLTCEPLVLLLLMMLNGRIRPFLGALQELPCSPCRVVLPTHVRGPLTHFSCLGPHTNVNASLS